MLKRIVLFVVLLGVPTVASAASILIDDFQSVAAGSAPSSSLWTTGNGQVVVDPLDASNQVLHFTALGDGGDIWTQATFGSGWLTFDFYGTSTTTSGGFIGWDVDQANAGIEQWLGGTTPSGGPVILLADNVGWRTYTVPFTVPVSYTGVYFKLEDWGSADNIAGNAYFDNLRFSDTDPALVPVPEPATFLLIATGLGSLVARRQRRRSDDPA